VAVRRSALVTGITGQDGAYLCRLLLSKGCRVYGAFRRGASLNLWRLHDPGVAEADIDFIPFELLEYYREAYGLFACSGILFNHERPLRGIEFVTRKITSGLASIREGHQDVVELGNLEAKRDWGFAEDSVEGMWLMLQQPNAGDYVLATGQSSSVKEFCKLAAAALGFGLAWEGADQDAVGVDRRSGRTIIRVNPKYYRLADVKSLRGDASKARAKLGWSSKTSLPELVDLMAQADLRRARAGQLLF